MVSHVCQQCGISFGLKVGRLNRALKIGAPLYCGKECAGKARRLKNPPTDAERRAAKAAYDKQYLLRDVETLKRKKAEYFQRTYDPKKAAIKRKERASFHAEYCRTPEYRKWKHEYDLKHRAKKDFGEFAEVALLLRDIDIEIESKATRYEIYQANGTNNKAQVRRRLL